MRYITLSYLNWHRNGETSKFEVWKNCLTYTDLYSKLHLFHVVFLDFRLQRLAIFMPVEVGESCISQKKALLPIVWKKYWNCTKFCRERLQTSFSRGSAFSLKRMWPCSILGLSNEVSFVSRFLWKIAENWEKEESIARPNVSNRGKLYSVMLTFQESPFAVNIFCEYPNKFYDWVSFLLQSWKKIFDKNLLKVV